MYNDGVPLESRTQVNQKSLQPTLRLRGEFQLSSKQALEILLNGTYANNKYNRKYAEGNYEYLTHADEDLYIADFQSNYNVQLKRGNSIGVMLSHYHQISSSNYGGDYSDWNHLWSGETWAMVQYTQFVGKKFMFNVQGGMDFLHYRVHGNRRYSFLSPRYKMMMNYQINPKRSILFTILRGNSHPSIDKVNRIERHIDPIKVQQGNIDLDKENIYQANLVYSAQIKKVNMQIIGFWNGAMPAFSDAYYADGERLVKNYCTDGEYHLIGFAVDATYKVNRSLKFKALGSYQNFRKTGKLKAHLGEWVASLDMNYYRKDFAFNLFVRSTSRNITPDPFFIRTPMAYGCSVGWSRNKWNIEAGTQNLFGDHFKDLEYLSTDAYAYKQIRHNKTDRAMGYLKIAYVLDFGKKTSHDKNSIDTNAKSAIMRGE